MWILEALAKLNLPLVSGYILMKPYVGDFWNFVWSSRITKFWKIKSVNMGYSSHLNPSFWTTLTPITNIRKSVRDHFTVSLQTSPKNIGTKWPLRVEVLTNIFKLTFIVNLNIELSLGTFTSYGDLMMQIPKIPLEYLLVGFEVGDRIEISTTKRGNKKILPTFLDHLLVCINLVSVFFQTL